MARLYFINEHFTQILVFMAYLFASKRLGFRNWKDSDLPKMAVINSDPTVMKHFPGTQSKEQTAEFIVRMKKQFETNRFCYFAVDELEKEEFIGFIGISEQTYEADFTPCIDIGWRIAAQHWDKGFATEGAKKVLAYAFNELGLDRILSIAPMVNTASEHVMQKIGMQKVKTFEHSLLKDNERLKQCVLYEIKS